MNTTKIKAYSVALIGSFRKHYDNVIQAAEIFTGNNWVVRSPKCTPMASGGLFVRFESDDPSYTDAEIQSITLRNIFDADVVYVVNPSGYIGRTTCYEVGRVIQRRQPIYFLSQPNDFPVEIPTEAILSPEKLVASTSAGILPKWLYNDELSRVAELERAL